MLSEIQRRAVDISYEKKLSHLSSVLNTVDIVDKTYEVMKEGDVFVLGNSHAALALYVVLEKHKGKDAEKLYDKHGTHANRDLEDGIFVSGGSLGQAETVAVGLAMADKEKDVYLVTSDGACAEGSVWEALMIARNQRLENLRIAVIANGHGAYGDIDVEDLNKRLNTFYPTIVHKADLFHLPDWIQGVAGHYCVLDESMYKELTGDSTLECTERGGAN
jgi:transketolase